MCETKQFLGYMSLGQACFFFHFMLLLVRLVVVQVIFNVIFNILIGKKRDTTKLRLLWPVNTSGNSLNTVEPLYNEVLSITNDFLYPSNIK